MIAVVVMRSSEVAGAGPRGRNWGEPDRERCDLGAWRRQRSIAKLKDSIMIEIIHACEGATTSAWSWSEKRRVRWAPTT